MSCIRLYYIVTKTVDTDGKVECTLTECEGQIPSTSTLSSEGGKSIIETYFNKKENAELYAKAIIAESKGELDLLLSKTLEGLKSRIGTSKLKQVREDAGLSQYQLAKKVGIKKEFLQSYEQGLKRLSKIDVILKICLALGCQMEDIIDDPEILGLLKKYKSKG